MLPFNDIESVEKVAKQQDLAAILVEPEFLKALRDITTKNGAALIFDEIQTAFRLALGGAQEYFGVTPDLVALGKVLGGGYPIGACAGRREIMEIADGTREGIERWEFAHHAGTFCGNPISMAAGLTTLEEIDLADGALNRYIIRLAEKLPKGLNDIFSRYHITARATGLGPFSGTWFTDKELKNPRALAGVNRGPWVKWGTWLVANGIYRPPAIPSWFLSTAHTDADIETLIAKTEDFFEEI